MNYRFSSLAEAMGESETHTFRRLRVNGARRQIILEDGIDIDQAERWALKLGMHPFEVWPEMVNEALLAGTKACAACGGPFVPSRPSHVYCCHNCRVRVGMRRRRLDPEIRARELQARRRYAAESRHAKRLKDRLYRMRNGDRIRAQQRARYWSDPEYRARKIASQRRRDAARRALRLGTAA